MTQSAPHDLRAVRAAHQLALRVALTILRDPQDAEEVAQDTLERALAAPELLAQLAWVRVVAKNLALSRLRRAKRAPVGLLADPAWLDLAEAAPDAGLRRFEARHDLRRLRAQVEGDADRRVFDDALAGHEREALIRQAHPTARPGDADWIRERNRLLKSEARLRSRLRGRLPRELAR